MKVAIGSDHAGFALKEAVKRELEALGHEVVDRGTDSAEVSVDYPDYAIAVGEDVAAGRVDRGEESLKRAQLNRRRDARMERELVTRVGRR